MSKTSKTTIKQLSVSNFKRISVADITPDGAAVLLAGRNAQGKSSVLDAIEALLRGGKAFPDVPVKRGESKATLSMTLDNGITIERGITEGGTKTLKVYTEDGMSPQHPQAWLDARLSSATCDPLAFIRSRPQDQAAELRRLTGVDTEALDNEAKEVYAQRTQDGRVAKQKAALLAEMPEPGPDVPDAPVSANKIFKELDAARELVAKVDELRREAENQDDIADNAEADAQETLTVALDNAKELRLEAEELRKRAAQLDLDADQEEARGKEASKNIMEQGNEAAEAAKRLRAEADAITVPDIEAIDERLSQVDDINEAVRAKVARAKAEAEVQEWEANVAIATDQLKAIEGERRELLAAAEWPVDGLSIDDTGTVTYQDVPLSQASQAEQLRVGLALALAGEPEIRVALIRDGSHLDADAMAALAKHAEDAGAQVWIERVGTHDAGAVVIEDGTVQAKRGLL